MTLLKMRSHPMIRTTPNDVASGKAIASKPNITNKMAHKIDHLGTWCVIAACAVLMISPSSQVHIFLPMREIPRVITHLCNHGTKHRSNNAERDLDALTDIVAFGIDSFGNASSPDSSIVPGLQHLSELSISPVFRRGSIF